MNYLTLRSLSLVVGFVFISLVAGNLTAEPLPKQLGDFANSWWYTPIGDELYLNGYTRDNEENIDQIGIWRSDGTDEGTELISDTILSYQNYVGIHNEKIGDRVFFVADQNNNGNNELYLTDVTMQQNALIKAFDEVLFLQTIYTKKVYKDLLFFEALTKDHGREIWISAGNPNDPVMLKDICPGDCYSETSEMIEFNDLLFFAANDGTHESELWVTDGSGAGTQLFLNIYPDGSLTTGDYVTGSGPSDFVVLGDKLIFVANDGVHGRELWVSDGTPMGTELLKDTTPGDNNGDPYDSSPDHMTIYKGKLYFVVYNGSTEPDTWEIWSTDGTEAGTTKLWSYDWTDSAFGAPMSLVGMNDKLFFGAGHAEYGVEIFYLDLNHPELEPMLLKDIFPENNADGFPNSSTPYFLTVVSGQSVGKSDRLYFKATSEAYGEELWVSDGTSEGTLLLKDFKEGSEGGDLDELYAIGSKLFLRESANYLWVVDLAKDDGGVPEGEDSIKPKLSIKKPQARARVKKRFAVRGIATDNKIVSKVQCKYPGQKEWKDASLKTPVDTPDGGQKVAFKCRVKLSGKVAQKVLRKGGRLAVKVRAEDSTGNFSQKKRAYVLK